MPKRHAQPSGEDAFRSAMDKLYAQKARAMGKDPSSPAVIDAVAAMIDRAGGKFNPNAASGPQVAARRRAVLQLANGSPAPAQKQAKGKLTKLKGKGKAKADDKRELLPAEKLALIKQIKAQAAAMAGGGGGSRADAARKGWQTRRAGGKKG